MDPFDDTENLCRNLISAFDLTLGGAPAVKSRRQTNVFWNEVHWQVTFNIAAERMIYDGRLGKGLQSGDLAQ